jgi:hypothetical protein
MPSNEGKNISTEFPFSTSSSRRFTARNIRGQRGRLLRNASGWNEIVEGMVKKPQVNYGIPRR